MGEPLPAGWAGDVQIHSRGVAEDLGGLACPFFQVAAVVVEKGAVLGAPAAGGVLPQPFDGAAFVVRLPGGDGLVYFDEQGQNPAVAGKLGSVLGFSAGGNSLQCLAQPGVGGWLVAGCAAVEDGLGVGQVRDGVGEASAGGWERAVLEVVADVTVVKATRSGKRGVTNPDGVRIDWKVG